MWEYAKTKLAGTKKWWSQILSGQMADMIISAVPFLFAWSIQEVRHYGTVIILLELFDTALLLQGQKSSMPCAASKLGGAGGRAFDNWSSNESKQGPDMRKQCSRLQIYQRAHARDLVSDFEYHSMLPKYSGVVSNTSRISKHVQNMFKPLCRFRRSRAVQQRNHCRSTVLRWVWAEATQQSKLVLACPSLSILHTHTYNHIYILYSTV